MSSKTLRRPLRLIGLALVTVFLGAGLVVSGVSLDTRDEGAAAFTGSSFDPGNIISDSNFYDRNAMSEAAIQSFLQVRVGTCANAYCLAVLRTTTTDRVATPMCNAYSGAPSELTSAVIFKVQQACGISARVLLVTLQKEQALLNNRAPTPGRIDRAMGYGCPDNTAIPGYCDPAFGGLYNQMYLAAAQLKRYGNPPGTSAFFTWFPVGGSTNVQFSPNAACGAAPVTIRNKATAALYYYTPYQPNAAALNNLGGTGDACSAYGNRNFWVFYSTWFGSPTLPAGTPDGEISEIWASMNQINLWGWAVDLDVVTQPIQVHVLINNSRWAVLTAGADNPTAQTIYPGAGRLHGFGGTISTSAGVNNVCAWAVNQGAGVNLPLGCTTLNVPDGSPKGAATTVSIAPNGISVGGWAVDVDMPTSAVPIHLTVDGRWSVLTADVNNPAGETAVPGAGPNHGFTGVIPATPGSHQVCIYAVNSGAGNNLSLGCSTVVVQSGSPVGRIGEITGSPGGVSLWGWALDPDTVDPIQIHVSVNASWAVFVANAPNPTVGAFYPAYSANHGFGGVIPASPGAHRVCAYAVNVASGVNTTLDCRTVVVPGGSPIGKVGDLWATAGSINLWGWTLDPDTVAAIPVHVQIDNSWVVLTANSPNASVEAAYPSYGPSHGFGASIPASPGVHKVCVFAVNVGAGSNTTLNCSTVTVP